MSNRTAKKIVTIEWKDTLKGFNSWRSRKNKNAKKFMIEVLTVKIYGCIMKLTGNATVQLKKQIKIIKTNRDQTCSL